MIETTLQIQSATIKAIAEDVERGNVIIASANGVDIYRKSDWTRVAWAWLENVTAVAVNDLGIWIGTSDAGVYFLPRQVREGATSYLSQTYGTETTVDLPSNAISDLAATGNKLAVAHEAGVSFLPSRSYAYHCTISGGASCVDLDETNIVYAAADQIYTGALVYEDWTTASHTNVRGSGTVAALALRGSVFFVAGASSLYIYASSTLTDLDPSIGSAAPTAIWPSSAATASSGYLAYSTSDGSAGGEFGIIDLAYTGESLPDLSGDTAAVWVNDDGSAWAWDNNLHLGGATHGRTSGDTLAAWTDDEISNAIGDGTLYQFALVSSTSPAPQAFDVRRDWTLYAEITDGIEGIDGTTLVLKVNGSQVSPTLVAALYGYGIRYAPAGSSGYSARVTVELSAEDEDGNEISRSWYFTTVAPPAAIVTDVPPPNVVCIRDIDLASSEADDTVDGVNVVWLGDITEPLIVNEDQAEAVGKVAIDENTIHRHLRTIQIIEEDITGTDPRDLQQGNIITLTCPAIGMTDKKCEILAIQRRISKGQPTTWNLKIAYYEAVA